MSNRDDDPSFERVVNTPTRGIGARTLDAIRDWARTERVSLWQAAQALCEGEQLPGRARGLLAAFLSLVEALAEQNREQALYDQARRAIEQTGLLEHYRKDKSEQAETRVENLEELVNAARQFNYEAPPEEEGLSTLDQFLAHAALEAGEAQGDPSDDCVQLMTLHSAKGLEFERVFMVGLEEGLFPGMQSMEEPGRLEEERRLCYVGITRARKQLIISCAESRRLYGKETYPRPSRFLREIPAEHLQEIRPRAQVSRPFNAPAVAKSASITSGAAGGFKLGQRVTHAKFGEGVILQAEGEGAQARVQVNFAGEGMKWLMLAYANLQPI